MSNDLGQSHPLLERIWDTRAGRVITRDELAARLVRARLVLLGEKHDNPRHHQLQAWALARLIKAGRRPVVAWEMITADERAALAAHLKQRPRDAAGLGPALGWKKRGWRDWSIYQPIAQAAMGAGLPMVDAGVGRAAVMAAIHDKGAASGPALPAAARATLEQDVRRSHCGHAGGRMLRAMVKAQRLRDTRMARQLSQHATKDGAVLIAGNGHARRDYGVPFYLAAAGHTDLLVLRPTEVRHGVLQASEYLDRSPAPIADYLWFTTRVDNLDPCEQFKKQLQRMKRRHSKKPTGS